MKSNRKKLFRLLAIALGILALSTVLPSSGATEPSILGYKTLCPFAPLSTIIMAYLALTVHRYRGAAGNKDLAP